MNDRGERGEPGAEPRRLRIAERRERLEQAVEALGRASLRQLSLGERLAEHPLRWLAVGLLVGLLLGVRPAANSGGWQRS